MRFNDLTRNELNFLKEALRLTKRQINKDIRKTERRLQSCSDQEVDHILDTVRYLKSDLNTYDDFLLDINYQLKNKK